MVRVIDLQIVRLVAFSKIKTDLNGEANYLFFNEVPIDKVFVDLKEVVTRSANVAFRIMVKVELHDRS